jgi:hypothetical protein
MARTKATRGRVDAGLTVEGVPAALRAFYDLGLKVRRTRVKKGLSNKGAARLVAADKRVNLSDARQALSCVERISEAELVRLGRMHTRAGKPVAVNHLRRLAMVADRTARRALMAGIGRHGWTAEELAAEIRRRKGEGAGTGGRKLRRPGSLGEGLGQVDAHCRRWLAHHDGLWSGAEAGWLAVPGGVADAGALRDRVGAVRGGLRRLARAARALEDRLGRVERGLGSGHAQDPAVGD